MTEDGEGRATPERYNFARDCVARRAIECGEERALLWLDDQGQRVELDFAEINRRSAVAAAVLMAAGVKRGDTVLILLARELEWWEIVLGCLRIGAIAAPGTVQLSSKDIAYRCSAAAAVCVVASATSAGQVDVATENMAIVRLFVGGERAGWGDYQRAATSTPPCDLFADTAEDDPILCYFTSGTTGQPKMTLHGAGYPRAHELTGRYWLRLEAGDLIWNLSDTGWAKAAWSSLFAPWIRGAAVMAYHTSGFDPDRTLDLLALEPVTTFCAPPTAYRMLVRATSQQHQAFPSLRHCVSAGEPLNPEVIDLWRAMTELEICDGYGQTETIALCCNIPGAARRGSMGQPLPGIDLAVIDDNGERLPAGIEGDIALFVGRGRPPGLFLEYRDAQDQMARVFRDGWYLTGDRGVRDEDGYFWFVGRADDVILTSGYRIGPFEVESALFEHPAVGESAVVSSPDPIRGEVVKAFVILAQGVDPSPELAAELQDHVKAITAPYKYPRKIEFVSVLPKTASGKIQRKLLRDLEWAPGKALSE